jgi:hypothetical protein
LPGVGEGEESDDRASLRVLLKLGPQTAPTSCRELARFNAAEAGRAELQDVEQSPRGTTVNEHGADLHITDDEESEWVVRHIEHQRSISITATLGETAAAK